MAFKLIRIKKRKTNNNINFNENIKEKYGKFEINEDYPEEYERYIFDRIKNRLKGPLLMGAHEYYFINGLFINKNIIHNLYENGGKYEIKNYIEKIIYSFLIGHFMHTVIKYFSLSERNIFM